MEQRPPGLLREAWILFFVALAVTLPLIWWDDMPQRDLACRYAPMAEALGRGDWLYALHPRIPPFSTFPAGLLVWVFGISGVLACQLVSAGFFAAGVFPLAQIYRRCVGAAGAAWGLVLAVFCSHMIRLGASGLRDTVKFFAFAVAVYGLLLIWEKRRRFAGYAWLAVGCALMIMTRGDCLLYAGCFGLTALVFEWRQCRRPWRSIAAGLLVLAAISPQLAVNWHFTGYPVPEVRFALLIERVTASKAVPRSPETPVVPAESIPETDAASAPVTPAWVAKTPVKAPETDNIGGFFESLGKGFYPVFAIPALLAIGWRLRRKLWRTEETIVLATVLIHAVLVVLQMVIFERKLYVSDRYLTTVSPLLFGWTAWGGVVLWEWLRSRYVRIFRPALAAGLLTVGGVALLIDAAMPTIRYQYCEGDADKRSAILGVAAWIRENYRGPETGDCAYQPIFYHSNRRPWVMAPGREQIGYLAGGSDLQIQDPEFTSGRVRPDYLVTPDTAEWRKLAQRDFIAAARCDFLVIWIPGGGKNR